MPQRRAVNLARLLTQAARRFPARDALIFGQQRWSWRELDERVDRLAAHLTERGVGAGDAVLVHSPNHPELVQAMFATWRIGAVFAPTNARLTPGDIQTIAELCRPAAMLCHAGFPDHAHAVAAAVDLPAGTVWVGARGTGSVEALSSSPLPADRPHEATVFPGDPCWYFFTSGTTGRPKAAVLTHEQMGFVVTNHLCDLMPGMTEQDVSLVVAPLSPGAGVHLLPQVAAGAASVLPTTLKLDPAEVWRLVAEERVTNMFTVPTILKLLVEHPDVAHRDHSSLRHVIYAGAPMATTDQARARAALGDVLVQYYGLAEVTGNITVLPPRLHDYPRPDDIPFGTCGHDRTGMQVSVQDEQGRELKPGEQGEICVAGPAVFAGYLDDDAANATAFRDGWFRTGDLGFVDESGFLYVTGRTSDMYISGGSNIHPREIEEKLLRHDDVAEAAVLGMPDATWGEVGVAVCVVRPGSSLDPATLRGWLRERMAGYKVPHHILIWDDLPKSGYGKIAKRAIREQLEATPWPPPAQSAGHP
jgi:acyl-CoA synthetase (AMP-forming)/AMP-acid ligase II